MPSEQPRLPKETHRYLLQGRDANRHMPIVGMEVAEYRRERVRLFNFLSGLLAAFAIVGIVVLVFYAGWVWAETR